MSTPGYLSKSNELKNLDNFVLVKSTDLREPVISDALSILLRWQKNYVLLVLHSVGRESNYYASTLLPEDLAKVELRDYLASGVIGIAKKAVSSLIEREKPCVVNLEDCDRSLTLNDYFKIFDEAAVNLDTGAKSIMANKAFVLYDTSGTELGYPLLKSSPPSSGADIYITASDFYNTKRCDDSTDPIFKSNYRRSKAKLFNALDDRMIEDGKLQSAVAYDGFNLKKMRHNFFEKNSTLSSVSEDLGGMIALINCFTAYAAIGNNIGKLKFKRTDTTVSQALMSTISGYKVEMRANSKDSLTLPRIAIAFMPQYFLFRKFILKDPQDQTSSVIKVVYKDQAFAGCQAISSLDGYKEYYEEFSKMISKDNIKGPEKKKQKMDAEEVKEQNAKWMGIATAGYNSDSGVHDLMRTAMNSVDNKTDAYKHIMMGIQELRISSNPATL